MRDKMVMQTAKASSEMICSKCGESFKAEYGIKNGEIYCPKCYNLHIEKQLADIHFITKVRRNRTILRLICFFISVACIILSILFKDNDDALYFSIAMVLSVLVGIFPFYRNFCIFIARGFNGFIDDESTVYRNIKKFYNNPITSSNKFTFLRAVFYLVDFILVWPCMFVLYVSVIPRAVIDIIRVIKADDKLRTGFDAMLAPEGDNHPDKYNFTLRFIDKNDQMCIDFYRSWKQVKKEVAIEALDKSLIHAFKNGVKYRDGYKSFLDCYYGRSNAEGKRFVFLDVESANKEVKE